MKKIITYGTFDILHKGHIRLLQRAKALGDRLVVGLSSDEFNEIKGKEAFYGYEDRKTMLEAIKYVDEIIPEHNRGQKINDIKHHHIDVFVMGSDREGKFDELKDYCEVIYLPRTPDISTTQLKEMFQK